MSVRLRRNLRPIGETLEPILAGLGSAGQFTVVRLLKLWPEVVGEPVARRTEVVSLKARVLLVKVSGAMWIQELSLMKHQILSRLRERLGDDSVRNLRFVKGHLSRRGRARLRAVPRRTRHSIELPPLEDPKLREAFESLIEAWGRKSR